MVPLGFLLSSLPTSSCPLVRDGDEKWRKHFPWDQQQDFSESWSHLLLWSQANYLIYLKVGFLTCKQRKISAKRLSWGLNEMGRLAVCLAHSRYPIESIYNYKDFYYPGSLPLTCPSPDPQLWGWAVLLVIPDLSEEGQAPGVESLQPLSSKP